MFKLLKEIYGGNFLSQLQIEKLHLQNKIRVKKMFVYFYDPKSILETKFDA